MYLKPLILKVVFLLTFIFATNINAKETVAFGGVTFQGGKKELVKLYPHSLEVVKSAKVSPLIFRHLIKHPPNNFQISPQLLDKDAGHRFAFTLMIDGENVSEEHIVVSGGMRYKVVAFLSAQVVMFDVNRSQFVASIPIKPVQYTQVFEKKPSFDALTDMIRMLLLDKLPDLDLPGLVPLFLDKIKAAKSPETSNLIQIAVGNVTIEEKAKHALPNYFIENDNGALKRFIAQQLIKNLSVNQQVATQPYRVDSSVLTMQGRFTGGDVTYQLTLPKPAYTVNYTLRGFKQVELEKKEAASVMFYGSFSKLDIFENSQSQRLIFSQKIKNGANKIIPKSQTLIDHWAAYRESLIALLEKSTTEIHNTKGKFFKAQKYKNSKSVKKQLSQLLKVYEQCRI